MTVVRRVGGEVRSLLALLVVSAAAAEFAHLLREAILGFAENVYGERNTTESIAHTSRWLPILLIVTAILGARILNLAAQRMFPGRLGLEAIANSAKGIPPGSSLRGTLVRTLATMIACMPGTSLGRESAILESGGALGCAVGRKTRTDGPSLAAAGVAAAFAAAYHAPFGAVIYVGGHLAVWRKRRAMVYAVIGAVFSHWLTVTHLGGHPVFPGMQDGYAPMIVLGLVALVPAFVGARLFVQLREWLPGTRAMREHQNAMVVVFALVSAGLVAVAPLSAGNGMEALRHVAVGGSIGAAVAMGLVKMLATSATLGAKAPGGVFSPTLAVAAGWALATFVGLEALGVNLPGHHWDGIIVAMSVGVAVGLHSPLLGAVVIAEMCGKVGFVPVTAVAAFVAHRMAHRLDHFEESRHIPVPHDVHEEDA